MLRGRHLGPLRIIASPARWNEAHMGYLAVLQKREQYEGIATNLGLWKSGWNTKYPDFTLIFLPGSNLVGKEPRSHETTHPTTSESLAKTG